MLLDTTLREGLQLVNTNISTNEKKEIISMLDQAGIEEIEIGWAGVDDLEEISSWAEENVKRASISIWIPCREKDIRMAAKAGIKRINMGMPSSFEHMNKRLGLSRKEILKVLSENIATGVFLGMEVSVGLEDIYGADFDFIAETLKTIERSGGFRVRFADTRGLMTPSMVKELVSYFTRKTMLEIACHFHNDFGMATANAVTALESGAKYVDASILGMGERAGISALEEIAARQVLMGNEKRYNIGIIKELCMKMSKIANMAISRTKPVLGRDIFSCESGIHIHAMMKEPSLMEPYSPEKIGEKRKIFIGTKCGESAFSSFLENSGIRICHEKIKLLMDEIRERSAIEKRAFGLDEIFSMTTSLFPEIEGSRLNI